MTDPQVAYETITPRRARLMLEHNERNRRIKPGSVTRYAQDMMEGRWQSNGAPIVFDSTGRLVDGQHRLHALIEADVSLRMLVVRGVAPDAQKTMDQAAPRTLADWLAFQGESNVHQLASVTMMDARWNDRAEPSPARAFSNYQQDKLTRSRCVAWFDAHREELREATRRGVTYSRRRGQLLSAGMMGVLWLNLHRLSPDDADLFFDQLSQGAGLSEGDAVLALRTQLIQLKSGRDHATALYKAALTIKAWNRFIQGEPVGVLRYKAGGAHRERFPQPLKP